MTRHQRRLGAGLRAAVAGLCAAVIAGGCVGGGGPGPGGSRGPVRVALIDVFSGTSPYASQGSYLQNSLQIEIDAMNADGGLLGSRVELVTVDDQLSLAATADQMRRVAADRSIRLLVGPSFAGMYLAAKPVIDQARLPNCLTNMAADDLMQGARYSFRAQAQDHASVPALLGYVQHGTQLKKIGLIAEEDGVGQSFDQQLSEQASRFGLQYLGAAFATATGDQKAQVQQILKQGAEGVVLSNNPATAARTLQAIAALKVGAKLRTFGFSGLAGYAFPQQAGDPANGVVFTSTIQSYLSDVPEARWPAAYHDFVKKAQTRFGLAPNGVEIKAVPAAGDCIVEWARAVQAANDFDGDKVARAWEKLDVPSAQSVLGVRERFSPDAHDAVPPDGIAVYQWVKNGAAWSLKQLVGPAA